MAASWKESAQRHVASLAQRGRLLDAMDMLRTRLSPSIIRAINYHWTPVDSIKSLEEQFAYFASHYESVSETTLHSFLAGQSTLQKPGLLISFDDGFRNHYEVAAPLLEKYGLTGWFFIVVAACDPGKRIFNGTLNSNYCMGWEEIRDLRQRGHEIGSHTLTHAKLGPHLDRSLQDEVVLSREVLSERLDMPIQSFCYPYGTADCYTAESLACVAAHYRFAFHNFARSILPGNSSLSIGRIPFEPYWSVGAARLRISGLFDRRYRRALKQYERLLGSTECRVTPGVAGG